MSDWKRLNAHRIGKDCGRIDIDPAYYSTPLDGFNGMFIFACHRRLVKCVASDGMGWKHVSVSIINESETPSWEIMSSVKDLFWEEEDCVVQYHPPKSLYVNFHPGCLHLWQPRFETMPMPHPIMVGPVKS